MISIFQLWTFHLYVATFQRHLPMQIYLSIDTIFQSLWLLSGFPWWRIAAKKGSYWTKGYYWLSWSHHFGSFTVTIMTWLTIMEYLCHKSPRIFCTCRNSSRSFPHSWLISEFVPILTRRVPLVEQKLPTLAEHLLMKWCGHASKMHGNTHIYENL